MRKFEFSRSDIEQTKGELTLSDTKRTLRSSDRINAVNQLLVKIFANKESENNENP